MEHNGNKIFKLQFVSITGGTPQDKPNPDVKKVFIRRNIWDNYGAFVGSSKRFDDGNKEDLIDRVKELFPNAEIIDRTTK